MAPTLPRPEPLPVLLDQIPSALTYLNQWVLWKTINRAGKLTKVPYDTTGNEGDSSDASRWESYSDVVEAYQKGGYDGIGFVFDPIDAYAGVDLDHCINEDGSIKPKAKAILDKLNSYCEISPSGTGVKIFPKAKNPVKIKNAKGKYQQGFTYKKPKEGIELEVYYGDRFFTLTGNRLTDYPATIEDRNDELTEIFKELFEDRGYFAEHEDAPQRENEYEVEPLSSDAAERLQVLFEADPTFKTDLYTPAPKGKRSDVEFHLCARLWEAGFSEAEIYHIMTSSPQTKWRERDDNYRWGTIKGAVAKAETSHKEKEQSASSNSEAPPENSISEEELDAYSLPEGPKFECNLPADHFIQRFMAYGSDISDAYIEYWFAGGLFALAVAADKKIKMVLKQGTIYPNLYVSINGKSSLARKSTVVDKTEAMLCQVLIWLLSALVPTEFSPEAFTEHLSDHNHAPWIRDEAAGVLSIMKRDYMRGFKDSLMQLFECKPFYRKLRTSQRKGTKTEFRVDDPYLNVLFATTDASLGANTEQNDTLSGFMARFLFFFPQGKKTKWLPLEEGTAANSIFEGVVRDQLSCVAAKMIELPECTAMHFSPDAAAYYTEWQRVREDEWTASNDGNAMQIYSRLAPMVTKLGMLFELGSPDFDVNRPIRLEFIQEACQLVDSYFLPTARAVYDLVGVNAEKNVIDRIIAYLKKHGGKATKTEIMRDVKIKSADFNDYLDTMIESAVVEIKTVKRGGKGRDSLWVLLLDTTNVDKIAKIAKIAKIDEIRSKNDHENGEGTKSILAILATQAIMPIVDTLEKESPPTIGPHPRKDEPTPAAKPMGTTIRQSSDNEDTPVTARFKTDYQTDIDGEMKQFHEGDLIEVSSMRAEAWQKRGVAEIEANAT